MCIVYALPALSQVQRDVQLSDRVNGPRKHSRIPGKECHVGARAGLSVLHLEETPHSVCGACVLLLPPAGKTADGDSSYGASFISLRPLTGLRSLLAAQRRYCGMDAPEDVAPSYSYSSSSVRRTSESREQILGVPFALLFEEGTNLITYSNGRNCEVGEREQCTVWGE